MNVLELNRLLQQCDPTDMLVVELLHDATVKNNDIEVRRITRTFFEEPVGGVQFVTFYLGSIGTELPEVPAYERELS